jgi:hypothetical protein
MAADGMLSSIFDGNKSNKSGFNIGNFRRKDWSEITKIMTKTLSSFFFIF